MHPDRQNALMDMNYNLGLPKFKKCMNGINLLTFVLKNDTVTQQRKYNERK